MDHASGSDAPARAARAGAESHGDPVDIPQSTPEPKDDYLVALYREADADALVAGDADFAGLTGELVVMAPAEMFARI